MTAPAASNFGRQSAHMLVTSGLSVLLGLSISVLLARTLGPAAKGTLDLAGASTGLFALVIGCSAPAGITHAVARQGGVWSPLAFGVAVWGLAAGWLAAACLLLAPDLSARIGLVPANEMDFWPAYIVGMVMLATWTALLRGVIVGRHALVAANRIEIALKAVSLALFAGLASFAALRSARAFALAAMSIGAVNLVTYLLVLRDARVPGPARVWRGVLATALPLHAANVLHFLNQRVDVFFVQAARGTAEVGRYAVAVSLAQFILLVSAAFAQPLLPQVSAAATPRAAAEISAQACRIYTALALGVAAALGLVMPTVVPLLFGDKFAASVPLLLILLPGVIASGLTSILVSFFVGVDRPRINLLVAGSAALVTLAGNAWLTPRSGALGAALTSTGCYALSAVLSVVCFTRISGLGWHRLLWPNADDWRMVGALATRFRP